jgi:hypothetical protein
VPRRVCKANNIGGATFEDYLDGLTAISNSFDTPQDELPVQGILLLSLYFPASAFSTPSDATLFAARMKSLLRDIVKKGLLPITGSGNDEAVSINKHT